MKPYADLPELSLKGRTIVITGASDGIGAAAARELARRGARLVLVGRSVKKTQAIAKELGQPYFLTDFAELDQVRKLAADILASTPTIDALINNAGFIGQEREITSDGHEKTVQVNHLAPFLLTHLLHGRLAESNARVIFTSSSANQMGRINLDDFDYAKSFKPFRAYCDSKLYNAVTAAEIARRWAADGITAASFHPGVIRSQFGQGSNSFFTALFKLPFAKRFLSTTDEGADTLVWLAATEPGTDWTSGGYYAKRKPGRVSPVAKRGDLVKGLRDRSAESVGLRTGRHPAPSRMI